MKRFLSAGVILLMSFAILEVGGQTPRKEDMPKYLEMLQKAPGSDDRAFAADMIGKRGAINLKDVADAVVPLRAALKKDPEVKVRRAAAKAIAMIAPEPASDTVPLLIDTLGEKDYSLRMAVVQALAAYGNEARDALPALRMLQKQTKDKKDAKTLAAAITVISEKKKKKT